MCVCPPARPRSDGDGRRCLITSTSTERRNPTRAADTARPSPSRSTDARTKANVAIAPHRMFGQLRERSVPPRTRPSAASLAGNYGRQERLVHPANPLVRESTREEGPPERARGGGLAVHEDAGA